MRRRLDRTTVMIVLMAALCVLSLSVSFATLARLPVTSAPYGGLPMRTSIRHGRVEMTVRSLTTTPGKGHYAAPRGSHFAIVTIAITNRADQPIMIAPTRDTYMKSTTGQLAYLSPVELENPLRAGQLLPQETIQGELSYQLLDGQSYALYVDSDWSGGVVKFNTINK